VKHDYDVAIYPDAVVVYEMGQPDDPLFVTPG